MKKHLVVAKIILEDADHRILVLRRSVTHPAFAYHLDFPGGEVEEGEAPLVAICREVREETGLLLRGDTVRIAHEKQHKPP